jgi:hypothetical protein
MISSSYFLYEDGCSFRFSLGIGEAVAMQVRYGLLIVALVEGLSNTPDREAALEFAG